MSNPTKPTVPTDFIEPVKDLDPAKVEDVKPHHKQEDLDPIDEAGDET